MVCIGSCFIKTDIIHSFIYKDILYIRVNILYNPNTLNCDINFIIFLNVQLDTLNFLEFTLLSLTIDGKVNNKAYLHI